MSQRTDPGRAAQQLADAQRADQRRRRAEAIARLRAFQRWLTADGDLRPIPEIPTYRIFR